MARLLFNLGDIMSSTQIFGFNSDGNAYLLAEVNNSWRGAMAIWRSLEEKYLPKYIPLRAKQKGIKTIEEFKQHFGYEPFSRCSGAFEKGAMDEIWALADRKDITSFDKICLFTTFDKCLIKKEDIPKVVEAFRAFEAETSLKEQANILEKAYSDSNCIAIGWNQTNVMVESWSNFGGYDEKTEESIPYNCLTGDMHYWLFDEIDM